MQAPATHRRYYSCETLLCILTKVSQDMKIQEHVACGLKARLVSVHILDFQPTSDAILMPIYKKFHKDTNQMLTETVK